MSFVWLSTRWLSLTLSSLGITFVASSEDEEVLKKIQERFTVAIPTL